MIGVIADDLTGAAEIGAVGLRHGWRAEVITQSSDSGLPRAETPTSADLVCLDTDSRSCTASVARELAASAALTLRALAASWIYKKVDSVLRGNIVAELEGIMSALRLTRTLLVPANPSLGRTVHQGSYWVSGKPIHETEFRLDPEYPRGCSSVCKLLGASNLGPIQVCTLENRLPATGVVVGEAETPEDLRQWAKRCDDSTLAAGAAEFFAAALLEAKTLHSERSSVPRNVGFRDQPELFLCGSTSESCRTFVAESRGRGVPVIGLPAELARGAAFSESSRQRLIAQAIQALGAHSRMILTSTGLPPPTDWRVARELASHLSQVAASILRRTQVGHVFVEGGATAAHLVRAMGWGRLRVLREIAPGVVTLATGGDGAPQLTLKPGSYVWPESVKYGS